MDAKARGGANGEAAAVLIEGACQQGTLRNVLVKDIIFHLHFVGCCDKQGRQTRTRTRLAGCALSRMMQVNREQEQQEQQHHNNARWFLLLPCTPPPTRSCDFVRLMTRTLTFLGFNECSIRVDVKDTTNITSSDYHPSTQNDASATTAIIDRRHFEFQTKSGNGIADG